MTVTVKNFLSGKLDQRHGKGPKIVVANITLEPNAEVLRPASLDMKSMKMIIPQSVGGLLGSSTLLVNLVGPGSVGNYASFVAYRITVGNGGTMAAKAVTGTITATMLVIGD